ncbi:MAG TPA: MarR family transcriptional regulator, partial [Acidimicrobiales bacterium]
GLHLPPPHDKVIDHTGALALALVAERGGCRPSYLADALVITTGGVTRLLDRLEAADLVERAYGTDRTDRRSVLVTVTTEGTRQLDRVLERLQQRVDDVLETILAISALLPLDKS